MGTRRQTHGITGKLTTRSSLESHKLDLMAEVSSLKIRLARAENEHLCTHKLGIIYKIIYTLVHLKDIYLDTNA